MNPMFSRTFKALCAIAVVAVLSACGSSSTVDPFKPTRVIGLGDARNDMTGTQYTVQGTLAEVGVPTVVGQVAVLFGVGSAAQSSVVTGNSTVADLITQVNALGTLQATDLIVITSGTAEFAGRAGAGGTVAAANAYLNSLKTALNTLISKGATHILLTSVVDTSVAVDADMVSFNSIVSGGLGQYANVARWASVERPAAAFPNWATNTNTPYCGAGVTVGCAFVVGQDATPYFLADDIHPTPAGNRWIAQYLYNVTGQGWR